MTSKQKLPQAELKRRRMFRKANKAVRKDKHLVEDTQLILDIAHGKTRLDIRMESGLSHERFNAELKIKHFRKAAELVNGDTQ